jgi:uncharacterized protein YigE (DUF2233 family)
MLRTRSLFTTGVLLLGATSLASGVECAGLKAHDTRYTVCRVDVRKEHLQLFLYDEAGKAFNSFQRVSRVFASQNQQLAFAMNAGMYREDFSPVGLMVTEGRQVHRLNLATGYGNFYIKPNGVFILSSSGARIVETSEYRSLPEPAQLATQSGPLLVQGGRISPALNPQGTSKLIRNGVGVTSPEQVVFVISEDTVSFYEFAQMFKESLHCIDALYLDGNVSSLYSQSLGRDDNWVPLGPIFAVGVSPPPKAP